MRTWSLPLAAEAVVCAGLHTLMAPLSLGLLLVPMASSGPLFMLIFIATAAAALLVYWQLALATIERSLSLRTAVLDWRRRSGLRPCSADPR